jgi:prophage DNA circulation protein
MLRAILWSLLLITPVAGCRAIEREGSNALPENAAPLAYVDMINRARGQATSALDAYYVDAWLDLEQAAQRLEQTARLLPKTTHIPEAFKAKVEPESDLLRQDAVKLLEAARATNTTQVNEAMQRIHQRIRQLRPAEK